MADRSEPCGCDEANQLVTLREAMVAVLDGKATSACHSTNTTYRRFFGSGIVWVPGDLRVLAGLDPDNGPREWRLVK